MDIMLDIETLGVRCGSVILSIGACVFGRAYGPQHDTFHMHLNAEQQMAMGATMDASTVLWWLDQSDIARRAIAAGQENAVSPLAALEGLTKWLDKEAPVTATRRIWANGTDFDLALLTELYRKFGRKAPWPYNGARDMRTILDVVGKKATDLVPAPAGAHDALVDAVYQAEVVYQAFRYLNSGDKP
jgi:exodeoxyribonuclease VIII